MSGERSPETIQEDIAETREQLGDTVAAVAAFVAGVLIGRRRP